MTVMSPKTKRILQIVGIVIVVLGVGAFSLRGWIRGTLGLAYVRSLHLESFSKQFEENRTNLNAILKPYHLDMGVYSSPACVVASYKFIQANYRCDASARSVSPPDVDITASFNEQWERASSDAIEAQLAQQGWHQLSGSRAGVGGMLSGVAGQDSILIFEQAGLKPECTLTLYGQLETNKKYQLASSLTCERRVYVFGGYKFDH